jgi:hypothetical protein
MIEESLLKSNFIGRDGFRWWIGQVPPAGIQNDQISKQGWGNRVKVRIMGYHPFEQSELPDNDLPWASILLPTTAGTGASNYATSVKIRPGDTVFGFFIDGDNAQVPVITGCFGRTSKVSTGNYKKPFIPFTGYTDKIPPPNNGTLSPDQSNEQATTSQKSPRSVSPKVSSKLNQSLEGFQKEISYFSAIGSNITFASFEKDVGVFGIIGEVGNLLGRVAGIPNLQGVLNTATGVAENIASGNIAGAISGGLGGVGGLVGGTTGNVLGQVGNIAAAGASGNIVGALGGLGGLGGAVGGTTGNVLGQVGNIAAAGASGDIAGALGGLGGLVGGSTGNVLGQIGSGFSAASNIGSGLGTILGSSTGGLGGGLSSVLGVTGGIPGLNLLSEINSSVNSILGMTNGIVGAMFNSLFNGLIPILKQGLELLYREVFAKVYAITPGDHAVKFAAAHAAGVLAQTAMIPFVKKLEESISCKAASTVNRLKNPIRQLLIRSIRNIENFIPCAGVQFMAALNNHIIDKIREELSDELRGIAKILSPGFDVSDILRKNTNSFSSKGGIFDCNQNKSKSKGNVKEWEVGCGPKGSVKENELFRDILTAMKTIQGTGKDNAEFNDKFGEWPVLNNPLVDNEEGVSPTDPNQSQSQSPPSKKKGSIKAEFIRKGGEFYVQVTGNGSGQIEFLMDVNDDAFNASVAASKIEVPSDKGIIAFERTDQLERYRGKNEQPVTLFGIVGYKEREKIRKKGRFTAGKTYGPIKVYKPDNNVRAELASKKRINLRDNDGDDANIKFTIEKIKSKIRDTPESSLPECICDEPELCNPTEIIIYGGDTQASAVPIFGSVNAQTKTGSIIGAKVTNPGSGFDTVPIIEFFDNCARGYGAIGQPILNEFGQLDTIYMISTGENYTIGEIENYIVTDVYVEDGGVEYDDLNISITDDFGNTYDPIIEEGAIVKVTPTTNVIVTDLPIISITIRDETGIVGTGAILRPIIGPVTQDIIARGREGGELKQVIDCI